MQIIFFGFIVFVIDQLSKFLVMQWELATVYLNPGISFGWLSSNQTILYICIILLLCLGAGLVLRFQRFWLTHPFLVGSFLGGAVSNICDRIIWGGVRDWLPIPFTSLKNNLADWLIVLPLVMLVIRQWRQRG